MKTIFRKLTCGLLLFSTAVLGGCSNDPEGLNSELLLDRALMPLNFKAAVQTTGNEVKLTWDVRSTVPEYEVVIYADEAMTQVVKTLTDIAPADVPVTVTLDAEKTYYASVQAFAADDTASASKKATAGPIKTYAIMSGLNPAIIDRSSTSLSLEWDADGYVSHILIQPIPDGDPVEFALTAAQIEAGAVEVTDLAPSTEYTLSVFYNSASRGNDTAWTRPDTQGATEVATAAALLQAVTDGAEKILVKYSETPYDVTVPADVPDAVNAFSTLASSTAIYGETTKEGKKPVVKGLEAKLQIATVRAAGYSFHLEDLTLDGNAASNVVNLSAAGAELGKISIKNCEIYNYKKGILSENLAVLVGDIELEGLFVHDIAGEGGDVLDLRQGTYTNFTLKNSTFYNGGRAFLFIDAKTTVTGQIIIRNNTISNFGLGINRKGLICVRSLGIAAERFFVEKNVILNQNAAYSFISDYKECTIPQFSANYFFNYDEAKFFTTTNTTPKLTADLCLVNGSKKLVSDPCQNSMKGKLYLTDASITAAGVGDPRWWTAVPPVVPEQTELIPLTDKMEWDFANTDNFEAQELSRTRILNNVQFIVADETTPMSIDDKGQVVFSQASTVTSAGVATNNALAFVVKGAGSVVITPADAGYNKHMEIIVNGIRKAIPANGMESVYGFGDLQGENTIYICSCSPVKLSKLGWTTEVVSGGEPQQLTTPEPTVTPESVEAGSETAVAVAWPAVVGAVSYDVTLDGKTTNVTTVSYTIPAAAVKALKAGLYDVEVVAKPQEGSKSYTDSEAGTVVFKVNAVLTTISSAKTWDISDAVKFPAGNITETTVVDNLQFIVSDPTKGMTIEHSVGVDGEKTDRIKFNGKSSMSGVVPANRGLAFRVSGNGTLTYRAVSSSGTGTGRHFQVSANGAEVVKYETPLSAADATDQSYEFTNLSGETTIYIYCDNTINIYGLGWEPSGGSAPGVSYSWNFSDPAFSGLMAALAPNPADLDMTVSGLRVNCGSGSIKSGVNSGSSYIQMGGTGSSTKRVCSFKAPVSGKLTVVASNTGGTEDLTRLVTVEVEGEAPVSLPGGSASSALTPVEFDLTVATEKTVYIYCTGNGLRFYSIAFSSASN